MIYQWETSETIESVLDRIERNPHVSWFSKHRRKETAYEQIYKKQCGHHYNKIAKYIIKNGLYLPENLLPDFDYFNDNKKKDYRQAKIMHELVTENFYNRTWTPKGDIDILRDENNNPITREAFAIKLTVYKQSKDEAYIQETRRATAEAKGSPANIDWDKLVDDAAYILKMYSAYPDSIELNPFETTANNEPVCSIPMTQRYVQSYKEYRTFYKNKNHIA